jgi:hypothetical protein
MSEDYAHGRRDGLRLALSVLAAEEAKWSALLGSRLVHSQNASAVASATPDRKLAASLS